MKNKFEKMVDLKSYTCTLCGLIRLGRDYPKKSKTGNYPPICMDCRQTKHKQVREELAIEGKYGRKVQSAERMRRNPTDGESDMNALLKAHSFKFKPQVVMYGFIADFLLKSQFVIIEVDGGYHTASDQQAYDLGRDSIFYDHGFRTVRVTNEEVRNQPELCLERIREMIAKPRLVKVRRRPTARMRVIAYGRMYR